MSRKDQTDPAEPARDEVDPAVAQTRRSGARLETYTLPVLEPAVSPAIRDDVSFEGLAELLEELFGEPGGLARARQDHVDDSTRDLRELLRQRDHGAHDRPAMRAEYSLSGHVVQAIDDDTERYVLPHAVLPEGLRQVEQAVELVLLVVDGSVCLTRRLGIREAPQMKDAPGKGTARLQLGDQPIVVLANVRRDGETPLGQARELHALDDDRRRRSELLKRFSHSARNTAIVREQEPRPGRYRHVRRAPWSTAPGRSVEPLRDLRSLSEVLQAGDRSRWSRRRLDPMTFA